MRNDFRPIVAVILVADLLWPGGSTAPFSRTAGSHRPIFSTEALAPAAEDFYELRRFSHPPTERLPEIIVKANKIYELSQTKARIIAIDRRIQNSGGLGFCHAALVLYNRAAILITGKPRSGKSLLAFYLIQAGGILGAPDGVSLIRAGQIMFAGPGPGRVTATLDPRRHTASGLVKVSTGLKAIPGFWPIATVIEMMDPLDIPDPEVSVYADMKTAPSARRLEVLARHFETVVLNPVVTIRIPKVAAPTQLQSVVGHVLDIHSKGLSFQTLNRAA